MNTLNIGDIIPCGATLLAQDLKTRFILAMFRGEFVTWGHTGDYETYWGHYFKDLTEATTDYNKRVAEATEVRGRT